MEAVVYLGLNTVRSLLLSVEIFSRYDPQLCPLFSIEALSQHSWLTARMARCLAHAERQDIKIIEQCFLAGLLHDIGQLILAFGLQAEYSEVIAKAKNDNLPVWQVEQEFFGASHADVGAYLLALWGLPDPIVEAVAMHHQPSRCAELEYSPAIAIHAADVFTHEFSQTDNETPPPQLDMAYLTRLGLADRIEAWRTVCQEALKT
jgi:putative nucleotidyltransferase with HDIG domain